MNIESITIGDIIAAGAVLMALWNVFKFIYEKFVKPRTDSARAIDEIKEDMSDIKEDVSEMKEKLASDYEQLSNHADRLKKLEERQDDFREFLRISLDAQRALIEHGLDGDNQAEMKKSLSAIDDYLKKHI